MIRVHHTKVAAQLSNGPQVISHLLTCMVRTLDPTYRAIRSILTARGSRALHSIPAEWLRNAGKLTIEL
jgi:hypothetical protein